MTKRLSLLYWLLLLLVIIPGIPAGAQNLITNPDFQSGNTGFTSGYTYVPNPNGTSSGAGQYVLVTRANAFNPGFGNFPDHTSGTGLYMVVDGAASSSTIIWQQTITGLTPNRNYQFSFWLLNAIGSNKARIQVSANSVDIGSPFTNPNDGGNWQLNTVTVNPGAGSQLILQVRDLETNGGGNDFGLDDFSLTAPVANPQLTVDDVVTASISTSATIQPTQISPLRATISGPSGATVSTYTLVTVPTVGTVRLGSSNGQVAVAGQVLSATQAGLLYYTPAGSTAQNVTFTYRATDSNGNFSANTATYSIPLTAPTTPPQNCGPTYGGGPSASGLWAEYYAGYFADIFSFFTNNTSGLTRIDPQLNFTGSSTTAADGWGNIIPPATAAGDGTDPNQFSTRHRGSVNIPVAGDYTFYLTSDDASYLWLDNAAFAPALANATINNGGAHGAVMVQNTVTLSAGLHNILIYYGEDGGGNVLTLEYSSTAGAGITRQIIPNSALCAGQSPLPPTAISVTNSPAMPSTNAATAIAGLAGNDPNAGGSVTSYIVATLPAAASGILYQGVGGAPVTVGQSLTAAEAATLSFDPDAGFSGNATFTFFAVNNAGIRSNLPATYTIPVVGPVADVTTALSGPATLGAGQPSGTYTATFTNNGPQPASQVTQTVRLPTGASMTPTQQAALPAGSSYDPGTNTITFGTTVPLASGATNTYTFSFTVPTSHGANTLLSTVGTSTGQGSNSAADTFTLNVTVQAGNLFVTGDDSNEVPANSPKTGNVILNDDNPANLANSGFVVQLVAGVSNGTLTLNANGSYTYTPASGYIGPDAFTYRVRVPGSTPEFSNTSTVSLNVYNSNQVCGIGTGTNLLVNPSFTQGNTAFSSDYGYVADVAGVNNELIPEALYSVGTDAANYHPSFAGTGRLGAGDNFMIVNGSQNLSIVYRQTITVQPNTYYSFSAFANSVNPGSPAQLGFVINGKSTSNVTTLGTTTSYQQIADLWFSGSNTTAVFEVRDVNKDFSGNDFGLDDLYFGTCTVGLTANDVLNRGLSNQSPATSISPVSASTAPGASPVASFTIRTLPDASTGVLLLNGTAVIPGQVIMLSNADQLTFDPSAGFVGTATFTYTATDNSGAGSSNTATFSIPVQDRPLPVTLVAFEAQAVRDTDARLTWRTATELNNSHFEVERSFDGRSFASVARVAGQGNSSSTTSYTRTDAGVAAKATGLVYYRLRQVDLDGTSSYSDVKTVRFSRIASISLAPNPTTATTELDLRQLPEGSYQVQVLDAVGRVVLATTARGGSQPTLDLRTAPSGTYIVLVRGEGGRQFSKRLVKQ
ncbi:cadherin-like domain-containing protein [Hymenobacter lapidiphilus]|uniref:Cadherin-like domain-containing protein n=1 Tax=Hymenobacter lapidiphilus TaxID=2608003 RepID=A0A7Y7PP24_9BACT|nr:cadherin-like domain-containing protein [Hymenobacter lapidiphilus]NVO31294.1 cadherin-like domain-containing protein [Hymenobacter lapidiphilus]